MNQSMIDIHMQVMWNRLISVVEEQAQTLIRTCLDNGQKLILINRDDRLPGPHNIGIDNATAAEAALHAFLRAGCRRPAVVTDADGNEGIAIRSLCYLAISYDHRLVDGADAARFLQTMKARLEEAAFESELGL